MAAEGAEVTVVVEAVVEAYWKVQPPLVPRRTSSRLEPAETVAPIKERIRLLGRAPARLELKLVAVDEADHSMTA